MYTSSFYHVLGIHNVDILKYKHLTELFDGEITCLPHFVILIELLNIFFTNLSTYLKLYLFETDFFYLYLFIFIYFLFRILEFHEKALQVL